jgi:hypothetical protein
MSFSAPPDDLGFPVMAPGKRQRLRVMFAWWGNFWYDRREQRFLEWGEFSDWGASIFEAAGTTLATYYYNADTDEYDTEWKDMVERGTDENPKAIKITDAELTGRIDDVLFQWCAVDGTLDPDNDTKYEVFARWVMWSTFQSAVGECIYNFTHYHPRPGAGNYSD